MMLKNFLWKTTFLFCKYFLFQNVNIEVEGIKNIPKAPFIIVSNHDHPWDPPLLWFVMYGHSKKQTHFFAGNFLFTGLRKFFLLLYEQIPVQSGLKALNKEAFRKSGEFLKRKEIIAIFPCPHPVDDAKRALYTGIIKIMQENNVPYIPIKIYVREKWKCKSYYDKNFNNVKIYIEKPQKNILFKKTIAKRQAHSYAKEIMENINHVKHNNTSQK